jgi:GTPase SAR1 family protein
MYYRGAAAAVIVYDVTSADSFARAKAWVQELQRQGTPGLVMALAGNKADLEAQRAVSAEEAGEYAREQGLHFAETSAKTALNVEGLFLEVARRLPRPGAAAAGAGAAGGADGAAGGEGGRINLGQPAGGAAGAKKVGGCC